MESLGVTREEFSAKRRTNSESNSGRLRCSPGLEADCKLPPQRGRIRLFGGSAEDGLDLGWARLASRGLA